MKRTKPLETEAMIQRRIISYLEYHGWFVFANRSGKMNALAGRMAGGSAKDNGSPDLFCWAPGMLLGCSVGLPGHMQSHTYGPPRHFAIECKRKGGKQSAAQIAWCGKYAATGFSYVLAYSHEDIERFLQSKGWL